MNHIFPRLILALLSGITLLASAVQAQVIDEYSGQETYMRFCAACHGESGQGDGPVASGLPITVPDLTKFNQRKATHLVKSGASIARNDHWLFRAAPRQVSPVRCDGLPGESLGTFRNTRGRQRSRSP
jgi:hypothetical protein